MHTPILFSANMKAVTCKATETTTVVIDNLTKAERDKYQNFCNDSSQPDSPIVLYINTGETDPAAARMSYQVVDTGIRQQRLQANAAADLFELITTAEPGSFEGEEVSSMDKITDQATVLGNLGKLIFKAVLRDR